MSGGSFDYLCYKDVDDMLQSFDPTVIQRMSAELKSLASNSAAHRDFCEFVRRLNVLQKQIDELQTFKEELTEVLKAVEWWRSGDIFKQDAEAVIARHELNSHKTTD